MQMVNVVANCNQTAANSDMIKKLPSSDRASK